ncbi:MAG: glycine betaine/L-proline ABC transporter ATP-binding protein [Chloroflexi bacterium]|nr:glycine betaine/L-proline ABC transporter ATP-binding protein [Chloroflexota bacterium]
MPTLPDWTTPLTHPAPAYEIACQDVWKVFGKNPQHLIETIDPEQSRSQILTRTGHLVAVRGVSFNVQKGETFVVMGLSGSGKSTLVRCISRLIEPTQGAIIVGGQDVVTMDARQLLELRRHKISMVFQNFGLFPHRRVIENVAYGLEVQGAGKTERLDRAAAMLKLVGLAGWERHYPKQLSGGMQQRVGLARALAVDPQILLFDEPFSALDPLIRRDMQDELLNLRSKLGKTIIFITHDFAEALRLGDHIAIMRDGQFVQVGTPEDVVAHPVNSYVSAFTKDAPRAKILTAASIMKPCLGAEDTDHPMVASTAKLAEVIPVVVATDSPVVVVDESKRIVGCIDRVSVMQALVSETKV